MATLDQVVEQIRFALDQLSARNGHHEFEELCLYFARQRIDSNVLPATGPVSAGGDQGRDFETFVSVTGTDPPRTAFTCTLQRSDIAAKIRADVEAIFSSGHRPEIVYAFLAHNLEVSRRHQLQDELNERHGVTLEVIDGRGFAMQLADPDTFWIAERFLRVPPELYPDDAADRPEWYEQARARYRDQDFPLTPGELSAIRACARHATARRLVADLSWWRSILERFSDPSLPPSMSRAAIYEAIIVSLRGIGTLQGYEDRVRSYLAAGSSLGSHDGVEDLQIILLYVWGAMQRGLVHLEGGDVADAISAALETANGLLAETTSHTARAVLLRSIGSLHLIREPRREGIDRAVAAWLLVLDEADAAPLFPIVSFAESTVAVTSLLVDHPRYPEFASRLNRLVEERSGGAAVAASCRTRAMALIDAARTVPAIRELHSVKLGWFGGDTIRGSLLAMLLIANGYDKLRLHLAAKMYYLAVAYAALHPFESENRDLGIQALFCAAEADYQQGAWISFSELVEDAVKLHVAFVADPWDFRKHQRLQQAVLGIAWLDTIGGRFFPNSSATREAVERSGLSQFLAELWSSTQRVWDDKDVVEIQSEVRKQIGYPPFMDAGPMRTIAFRALGTTWRVQFTNSQAETILAELFSATAQIVLADIAEKYDLALLQSSVLVNLQASAEAVDLRRVPNNDVSEWEVGLGGGSDEQLRKRIMAIVLQILDEISLLPDEQFRTVVEELFQDGVIHKVQIVQDYTTLYSFVVEETHFEASRRSELAIELEDFHPPEARELAWLESPGPTYSSEAASNQLGARYTRFSAGISTTLPRILQSARVRSLILKLRRKGWLDWHIIAAISLVTWNYRMQLREPLTKEQEASFLAMSAQLEPEEADPVPVELFTEDSLEMHRRGNALASVQNWRLQLKQQTPNFEAVEQFLGARYGYWSDDVPHDQYLPAEYRALVSDPRPQLDAKGRDS